MVGQSLDNWAMNIAILVGFLIVLVVFLVVGIISLACLRSLIWRIRLKLIRRRSYRFTHTTNGRPLPPTSPGLCDQCQSYSDHVYFLPSGTRLCDRCYHNFAQI